MRILINLFGAMLILAFGVGGFMLFGQKPEVPRSSSAADNAAAVVETVAVQPWNQPLMLDIDGEAVTYRVVTVGAEVAGRIVEKMPVSRGGTIVEEGTPLFRIDDLNYRLDVQRLQAEQQKAAEELQMVSVELQNNQQLMDLATEEWQLQQKQFERIRTAYERNATTESELDSAQRQELAARNTLQTRKNQAQTLQQEQRTKQASLDLVLAQLQRAEADLARCLVVSPIRGTLVDDLVEQGDYIKSGDPLVHISDSSLMEVKCNLQVEELNWILQQPATDSADDSPDSRLRLPQVPCEVAYDLGPVEAIWSGVLSRYEGTGMDRDTRTFPCRVLVQHPRDVQLSDSAGGRPVVTPPTLLSGMYVSVRIPVTSPVPLLQLPVEAVRPGQDVWVARGGELRILSVSVAETVGDLAIVRAADTGLQPGDQVIVSPLAAITDGMPVTAVANRLGASAAATGSKPTRTAATDQGSGQTDGTDGKGQP